MKKLLLCLLLSHFCSYSYAQQKAKEQHNRIDDIENAAQAEKLLRSVSKKYRDFRINKQSIFCGSGCQALFDSLRIKNFVKADFDNDGRNDLLVLGGLTGLGKICLLFRSTNHYEAVSLRSNGICGVPQIDTVNGVTTINLLGYKTAFSNNRTVISQKMIFKFGGFIEYHVAPEKQHIIKNIQYSQADQSTGTTYWLHISQDKTVQYDIEKEGKRKKHFTSTIDSASYTTLTSLLNYINFSDWASQNHMHWEEEVSHNIKIEYDDEQTISYQEYGNQGTQAFIRFFELLAALRDTQKWQPLNN